MVFFFLGVFSKKIEPLRPKEAVITYECGFDSFIYNEKTIEGFCVQFFNIRLLYLLIDLEIALILPFFLKVFLLAPNILNIVFALSILFSCLILLLILEYFIGGFHC